MIGVRVALDTDIAIAILNRNPRALARYDTEGPLALPAVVAGELLYGALNSALSAANLERYRRFIDQAIVLPVDLDVARCYGDLRLSLKRAGRPIPENDLWIAASCVRHGLVLVTHDGHFAHCSGLRTEDWLEDTP